MALGKGLKVELHCHNEYSNGRLPESMWDLDCETSVGDQLEYAKVAGLDAFFITNHNTTEGYKQLLEYQKDNFDRYGHIKILPGSEISVKSPDGRNPHVGVLNIQEEINPYTTLDETLDAIKSQGAVSVANHPYDPSGTGILDESEKCDLIEGFNSNLVDVYSNIRAQLLSEKLSKYSVVGSDSHLPATMGRSTLTVYPEEKDSRDISSHDIADAMVKGNFKVNDVGYTTMNEYKQMLGYHMSDTKIKEFIERKSPIKFKGIDVTKTVGRFVEDFSNNPGRFFYTLAGKIMLNSTKALSKKVNMYGYHDDVMLHNSWGSKIKESFIPMLFIDSNKVVGENYSEKINKIQRADKALKDYDFKHPEKFMNDVNYKIRGNSLRNVNEELDQVGHLKHI